MKGTNVPGILKLGFTLMLYATVACVGLAFVYSATKTVIEQRSQTDLEAALKELFPEADGFGSLDGAIQSPDPSVSFGAQYEVRQGSSVIGAAITATGASYGGPATILIGVDTGGRISGIKIMDLSDTPGLGANASSPGYFVDKAKGVTFYGQFSGKSVNDPFEVKGDVIAITAATISSRSITRIVKAAGTAGKAWLETSRGGVK
ncbi:FMN-binding protein [Treponema primitia]|uniref:FMN-binding protein n=1 Tax=Treponema primitia TaxID=88058 RepID=UPI000255554B|nr:FMN-binding protein [Treponema primitia]